MRDGKIVHVIDDDDAARDSLAFLLQIEGFTVKVHESATAFLDTWVETDSTCIVTDVRMPVMDGITLLRKLRTRATGCPVIVITGHADIPLAIEAIASGAVDFIEKPYEADVLLAAVRAALDPVDVLEVGQQRQEVIDRLATLSERERQVFDRVVLGLSSSAIAEELSLSERSIEIHRANVLTKMQAATLSQLVRMALSSRGGS